MGIGADIGSIQPGRLADLAFIDGDPLQNIKDLRRVRRVMKDGLIYTVSSLVAGR
jgi:imidazolonepropionase-like amidohydrolase